MASFCGNCGFPLGANSEFCPKCGTQRSGLGSLPTPPPMGQGTPLQATKSNSGLKILLVLLVCLAVGAVAIIGTVAYIGHRVKQAVVQKAANYGVNLHSVPSSSDTPSAPARSYKACELFSKEDATRLLGEPIERSERQSDGCVYYGPAGLSAKLAQEDTASTLKRAQAPGSQVGGGEVADAVTKLLGSAAAANGQGGSGGEAALLTVVVADGGKAQMAALGILIGGIGQVDAFKGGAAEIPNLGDRAVRLANLGLNVLKGDTIIRIIPGPLPDANEKAIAVAREILPRL